MQIKRTAITIFFFGKVSLYCAAGHLDNTIAGNTRATPRNTVILNRTAGNSHLAAVQHSAAKLNLILNCWISIFARSFIFGCNLAGICSILIVLQNSAVSNEQFAKIINHGAGCHDAVICCAVFQRRIIIAAPYCTAVNSDVFQSQCAALRDNDHVICKTLTALDGTAAGDLDITGDRHLCTDGQRYAAVNGQVFGQLSGRIPGHILTDYNTGKHIQRRYLFGKERGSCLQRSQL